MLNTEVLWNKALTENNVRGIIYWLRHLTTEDKCNVEMSLAKFRCWLQHSVDLTKKELLSLCFGQCEGLWMFLDQSSFIKVHLIIQKLKNLLSLAYLEKTHAPPFHHSHISGITRRMRCVVGNDMGTNDDQHVIRQHILLGRLVQWWGLTGLLPQYPDAHELKQISQMWHEMDQNQEKACLELRCDVEDKNRWSSLIQCIVAHVEKQHGPLWISEDCSYQTYPPPSLRALLNLVLFPHIDIPLVQAIIMYFILDVSDFLQCKDDLLESFIHTFCISPSFSQQIGGFWLLDHGFVSDSMEILLSPKASSPLLSFHHHAVLRTLMRQGEHQSALKYLYYNVPAIENIQDARLCADVLLQNNHVSEAWMLLTRGQPGSEHLLRHFIHESEKLCFCGKAMIDNICKDMVHLQVTKKTDDCKPVNMAQENLDLNVLRNKPDAKGQAPCPLSALLYQCLINEPITRGDFITLLRETVADLNNSQQMATRGVVVWPKYLENTEENNIRPLSCTTLHRVSSPTPVQLHEERQRHPQQEMVENDLPALSQELHTPPSVTSYSSTSPDSQTSPCFFTSAPSSPSAVRNENLSRCGSILPLENPFAMPKYEDCQGLDDHKMPGNLAPQFPDLTLTLEGAAEAVSFKNLRRESAIDESGVDEIFTSAVPGNSSEPTKNPMVELTQTQKRSKSKFNLPSQCYSNEENEAASSTIEIPVDSHNFLMPEYDKIVYDKVVSEDIIKVENVTKEFSLGSSEQTAVHCQHSISTEASETSCFLELTPLRRAWSVSQAEKCLDNFSNDSQDAVDQPEILTSCALTETMLEFLRQSHERGTSVKEEEQDQTASLASLRSSMLDIDFNQKRLGSCTHQFQTPLKVSPSPVTQLSPSDQMSEKSPSEGKTAATIEAMCFRNTSARVDHCTLGSWWKQALETRRASTGLLPTTEQVPPVTKEKMTSFVLGGSQSQQPVSCLESSSEPKEDKKELKQVLKEESSSRRGSREVASHPVEQGSAAHRGQSGKRGKRFKCS